MALEIIILVACCTKKNELNEMKGYPKNLPLHHQKFRFLQHFFLDDESSSLDPVYLLLSCCRHAFQLFNSSQSKLFL